MNFGNLLKAFDAAVALRDAAMRFKGGAAPPGGGASDGAAGPAGSGLQGLPSSVATGLANQVEARLTGVVVAALKEAFDRDHARLELERQQLEEQRRRAEEAMRIKLRRQAAERELGRLRLLAATALVGWIASVILLVARLGSASTASRAIVAAAWLLLLGSLGAGFSAQGRLGSYLPDAERPPDAAPATEPAASLALWLLIGGLALAPISLLF